MASKKSIKGGGFKKAQKDIERKEGVSKKSAGAILASAGRKASAKAKKENPNLTKIKGEPKPKTKKK